MSGVVAGGLFNAIAFADAGFLFSKLNKGGYEDEMKRHNRALEKLSKAKEQWYESQVRRRNRMSTLRDELRVADKDIESTNEALDNLRKVNMTYAVASDNKPTIHDFYRPSKEMRKYQHITAGALGLSAGGVAGAVVKAGVRKALE